MYVDESGSLDLRERGYFVITGIVIHEFNVNVIDSTISNFKVQNFKDVYEDAEVHIHEIWQGKEPFDKISFTEKIELLDKIYYCVSNLPFTAISVVIDKKMMLTGNYVNWNIHNAPWTFLSERFEKFISCEGNLLNKGLLIVDSQTKEVNEDIRKIVNEVRLKGTRFILKFYHLFEEPLFVPSYNRSCLQVADVVSYCTLKYFCNNKHFMKYWNMILPKYRSNPRTNEINGYGLKVFPNESESI